MSHDLNLPPEIESRLFAYAQQTGQDAVHLMRLVVSRFVEHEIPRKDEPEWTDELNVRRCELIHKDTAGEIGVEERVELLSLQKRAERHTRNKLSVDLNLVSLIDIFTILIFFLLQRRFVEGLLGSVK